MNYPKRGEIWYVNFDPSLGTEINKTRPGLIVSNDSANKYTSKVTVLPLSGTIAENPLLVIIEPDKNNNLKKRSVIRIPDITTFDKQRLINKLGITDHKIMSEIDSKLRIHLNLK